MNWWTNYTTLVKHNFIANIEIKDLIYWRNQLLARTLIYLLPLCLIALIPGLYYTFFTGQYVIAVVDFVAIVGVAGVALIPGIEIITRKIIFFCFVYLFGIAMLFFVGLVGPGQLYLLMATILSALVLPTSFRFWSAWLNTFICVVFAIAIAYDLITWHDVRAQSLGEWVAVSTNLLFLSFLTSALVPELFQGLQERIEQEKLLKDQLSERQEALHQAYKKLEEKNTELEQFAYVASHDLREPLRMVTSFMQLLKTKYETQLDEKANTYIDFAVDGGNRMQKMIADLLELSRITGHGNKEISDLNDVLNQVKLNLHTLIEENFVEIVLKRKLPVLPVFQSDIARLFQNILSNAIKFKSKNRVPLVIIDAIENDDHWIFSIKDNGIGIDSDKHEKIFEIFARLHPQQTYEGTGIGLAVCKKVIEHHGGRIWIESIVGAGTTFYFTINKLDCIQL